MIESVSFTSSYLWATEILAVVRMQGLAVYYYYYRLLQKNNQYYFNAKVPGESTFSFMRFQFLVGLKLKVIRIAKS